MALVPLGKPSGSGVHHKPPGSVSLAVNGAWKEVAHKLWSEAAERRKALFTKLQEIHRILAKKYPSESFEPFEFSDDQLQTTGKYGVLPIVMIDQGSGAIFPLPVSAPHRFSWFHVAHEASVSVKKIGFLERKARRLSQLKNPDLAREFLALGQAWEELNSSFIGLAQEFRYLETWNQALLDQWTEARKQGQTPAAHQLIDAILKGDPALFASLREILKPARVIHRSFLPDDLDELPTGIIELPITTDISSRRFLREIEGALDTHWNQSRWAHDRGVAFHIHWNLVRENLDFLSGKTGLRDHLALFSGPKIAITTGGITTFVKGNVLVLGPGRITPRTLAHELGHLIGFGDCYLRTLGNQGIFGLSVLEWDNPIYPDDLMCDNSVGEPRAEVW